METSPLRPFKDSVAAGVLILNTTLRAPLSGTFLQTLPDLVTPMIGHSLSPRSCPATRSEHPPKGSGTNMTVEATKGLGAGIAQWLERRTRD